MRRIKLIASSREEGKRSSTVTRISILTVKIKRETINDAKKKKDDNLKRGHRDSRGKPRLRASATRRRLSVHKSVCTNTIANMCVGVCIYIIYYLIRRSLSLSRSRAFVYHSRHVRLYRSVFAIDSGRHSNAAISQRSRAVGLKKKKNQQQSKTKAHTANAVIMRHACRRVARRAQKRNVASICV